MKWRSNVKKDFAAQLVICAENTNAKLAPI